MRRFFCFVAGVLFVVCNRVSAAQSITLGPLDAAEVTRSKETRTVRVTEGTELFARLSPDGSTIALIVMGEVFVVDRNGGEARRLTNVASEATLFADLAWAPDSRRLVASSGLNGGFESVSLIDVNSARRTSLAAHVNNGSVWSPDGSAVLLAIPVKDSTVLWSYPTNGSTAKTRVAAVQGDRGYVVFSPEGRSIAFGPPVAELDLATGRTQPLADATPGSGNPSYSPDGQYVAYLSERSGTRQVWVTPRNGGTQRQVTTQAADVYDRPLSWTPDSRKILYTAAGQLHVVSVEGGRDEIIPFSADFSVTRWSGLRRPSFPSPGASRKARGIVHPQISPDGRSVVFGALGDLWLAPTSGGPAARLTDTPWTDEIHPRWSLDGRQLAYLQDRLGQDREICVVSVARSNSGIPELRQTHVFTAPRSLGQPVMWSPDGQKLAFFAQDKIGLIEIRTGVQRVIATAAWGLDNLVGWSSDGAGIVYTSVRTESDTLDRFYRRRRIRRASVTDSGSIQEIQVPGAYAVRGGWTQDLSRAAYDSAGVGYYVRVGAQRPIRIADAAPRFFSWSSDGKLLLYLRGSDLRLLNVESGEVRTLDVAPTYRVAPAPQPILLRNVRIIEGHGAAASAPSEVLLSEGRIQRISTLGALRPPRNVRVIEGGGRTLLPGLFDTHAHLTDGRPVSPAYAYHGVLTIRDVGTGVEWMQSQRERGEERGVIGPRLLFSGGMLVADVGSGFEPNLRDHREMSPTSPSSISDHVTSMAGVGSNLLKFNIRHTQLEATASRLGHNIGLPITSHYLFPSTFAEGLEGKEHMNLYFGSTSRWREDIVSMIKGAGTCVTPTLVIGFVSNARGRSAILPLDSTYFSEPATLAFNSPEALSWVRMALRDAPSPVAHTAVTLRNQGFLESVRRLRDAGVPLTAGTDSYVPGLDLHLELELLVKAGLTPLEAITAATATAARCLGVDNSLGSVNPGKLADLILVDGDPATEIRDLRRIVLVIVGGRVYTRSEILKTRARGSGRRAEGH